MDRLNADFFSFIASDTGTILSWSNGCTRITGVPGGDALGRPLTDFLRFDGPPADTRAGQHRRLATLTCLPYQNLPVRIESSSQQFGDLAVQLVHVQLGSDVPIDAADQAFALPTIIEGLPCIFYVIDREGRLCLWNARLADAVQRPAGALAGFPVLEFFDVQDREGIAAIIENTFACGHTSHEAVLVGQEGKRTPFLFQCACLTMAAHTYVFGTGIDITERTAADLRLRVSQRAIDASLNAIAITRCAGDDNVIEFVNPAFERLTGYTQAESIGRDPRFMRAGMLDIEERTRIRQALRARAGIRSVLRNRRKNGDLFWVDLRIDPVAGPDGQVTHFVAILDDVTEHKDYEERLRHLATHDALTGLSNRAVLQDRLDVGVARARRDGRCLGTVFLDLDNFKYINDGFGHVAGDTVLKAIAARLVSCVRTGDTVARVGGDEFVVVINDCHGVDHVGELVERMRRRATEPVQLGNTEVEPAVSIGVSLFPHDGEDGDSLLRAADAAMYAAKTAGKNRCQFYSAEIDQAVRNYLELERDLRHGIASGELVLCYQPKVDLSSGKVVGAEALVRWHHPQRGLMMPASFITFAEESGLIAQLGAWVLQESCTALHEIQAAGFAQFSLSVNLSVRQLNQRRFADDVAALIARTRVAAGTLELEVTESQLMVHPREAIEILANLKALGVRLSIDDFGTGYSSLSYLQKLPVDYIKIDRSFLGGIGQGNEDCVIAQAIIALGHNLNMRVIAEGVETQEQLDFLRRHHCDQIQGHFFSPAVGKQALLEMLHGARLLCETRPSSVVQM